MLARGDSYVQQPKTVNTDAITAERLEVWRRELAGQHATPLLLMGVGHNEKSGQITICTLRDVDADTLLALLRDAIYRISREARHG